MTLTKRFCASCNEETLHQHNACIHCHSRPDIAVKPLTFGPRERIDSACILAGTEKGRKVWRGPTVKAASRLRIWRDRSRCSLPNEGFDFIPHNAAIDIREFFPNLRPIEPHA